MRRVALAVVAMSLASPVWADSPVRPEAPVEAAPVVAALFEASDITAVDRSAYLHTTDRRARFVRPDISALRQAMRIDATDAQLEFNLFDDARFIAQRTQLKELAPNRHIWKGSVAGAPGSRVVVAMTDGAFAAEIRVPDVGTFEMHSTADGDYIIRHLDFLEFDTCAVGLAQEWVGGEEDLPAEAGASARGGLPTQVDVLVGYTDDLLDALGSVSSVESNIDLMVEVTNDSFEDSDVQMEFRLVLAQMYEFNEQSSASATLNSWRNFDGQADDVFTDRNDVGADICALLVTNFSACGIAGLMVTPSVGFASQAYNVTQFSCAIGNRTFAHECGHTMGMAHDRDNAGSASRPYAYGYRTPDSSFRSIMAYAPGARVPYWSSPDIIVGGMQPLGIPGGQPGEAHNARALNDNKAIVAAFRNTVIIDCFGDINDDGTVGSGDLSILIGSWGSFDSSLDLAGDGPVGSGDLAILIGSWGLCPTE